MRALDWGQGTDPDMDHDGYHSGFYQYLALLALLRAAVPQLAGVMVDAVVLQAEGEAV